MCLCACPGDNVLVRGTYYTLNLCHSSGVWDGQTTSLSSSNLTDCYCALWPLGAKLIYMLPVREISGRANCLAKRETAITALKCEHLCVCVYMCVQSLASSLGAGRTSCTYLCQGKFKSLYGFYLLMTSLCCLLSGSERWSFNKFNAKSCSYRSASRWMSLLLCLVHTSSQRSCDVRGSQGCPAPAVPAA